MKTYESGRLSVKYFVPGDDKAKSISFSNVTQGATSTDVNAVTEALRPVIEGSIAHAEITETYHYI